MWLELSFFSRPFLPSNKERISSTILTGTLTFDNREKKKNKENKKRKEGNPARVIGDPCCVSLRQE